MDALRASYNTDEDEDVDHLTSPPSVEQRIPVGGISSGGDGAVALPPPPLDLLRPPNSLDLSLATQGSRIRNFPHVKGNYALHVYIPVLIPTSSRMQLASFLKEVSQIIPEMYAVDMDYSLNELCSNDIKIEEALLGREFHISLGRTVPVKIHQVESILEMLRHVFHAQRRYWIEFSKWDVFINDDQSRTFLSLEVLGRGLQEITKQINFVDGIYTRHGLPEFYEEPRPHISLLWALGDISCRLKQTVEKLDKTPPNMTSGPNHIFMFQFNGIECKVGKKTYKLCKFLT